MENSALARFLKLRGKTSIVELNFIKAEGRKSDAVINMELSLNVFWNSWKDWPFEVKGNSKIKVYGLYLWDCGLSFPRNLGGKSNIRYLIVEKWQIFLETLSLSPVKNFPQWNIYIFFYQGFLSWIMMTHRTAREERGPSSIPLYHFHPLTNIQTFICNFACEMTITYF